MKKIGVVELRGKRPADDMLANVDAIRSAPSAIYSKAASAANALPKALATRVYLVLLVRPIVPR